MNADSKIASVKEQKFATKALEHQISPNVLMHFGAMMIVAARKKEEFKTT